MNAEFRNRGSEMHAACACPMETMKRVLSDRGINQLCSQQISNLALSIHVRTTNGAVPIVTHSKRKIKIITVFHSNKTTSYSYNPICAYSKLSTKFKVNDRVRALNPDSWRFILLIFNNNYKNINRRHSHSLPRWYILFYKLRVRFYNIVNCDLCFVFL